MGYITKKEEQARHNLKQEVLAKLCEMPGQAEYAAFESSIILILTLIPENEVIVAYESLLNRLADGHDSHYLRAVAERVHREVLLPRTEGEVDGTANQVHQD